MATSTPGADYQRPRHRDLLLVAPGELGDGLVQS